MNNLNSLIQEIKEKNFNFLDQLRDEKIIYRFNPVSQGILEGGSNLSLGFSCYALKTFYILKYWDKLSQKEKVEWTTYIKSFQGTTDSFQTPLFIDENFLRFSNDSKVLMKDLVKKTLNLVLDKKYLTSNQKLKNSIRAETKQAISTLYQVGQKPDKNYNEFIDSDPQLQNYLKNLDWSNPWSSGGQFSAFCVFSKINDSYANIDTLSSFSENLIDVETGGYFLGSIPNNSLLVNGAMKILSGLDWIDVPVHKPKKLIDFCLKTTPNNEGCDLVDIVYVLYRCLKFTDHRRKEIIDYLENLTNIISLHYFKKIGGFSYFINKSQTEYYGVKISKGLPTPDLHGNLLLIWAISMIDEIMNEENSSLNVLKP
tara:strand:- start:2979 stop:4088 length:1110 start_codon:yes stop_codon:yes gene_type:complete